MSSSRSGSDSDESRKLEGKTPQKPWRVSQQNDLIRTGANEGLVCPKDQQQQIVSKILSRCAARTSEL
ncbi:MAG: hypothetical protein DSM106950_18865 [Stigonema ocellatum SAG 48.90 = DSM 106950]|nr:hypothetical protein [Stigonema ocellatum SAG 48.90 = DSM 106950]